MPEKKTTQTNEGFQKAEIIDDYSDDGVLIPNKKRGKVNFNKSDFTPVYRQEGLKPIKIPDTSLSIAPTIQRNTSMKESPLPKFKKPDLPSM